MHLSVYVPSIICSAEIIFFLFCLFLDMNIFQKIRGENDNLCIAIKMVSLEVIRIWYHYVSFKKQKGREEKNWKGKFRLLDLYI